jgi:hypothetical protein
MNEPSFIALVLWLLAAFAVLRIGFYFVATPADKLPFWGVMSEYWLYRSGVAGKFFWLWGVLAIAISTIHIVVVLGFIGSRLISR